MNEIPYGQYAKAFEAIHSALLGIMAPPTGKRVTKLEFTYNADKDIESIIFKQDDNILFTLTFSYDADKDVQSITRIDT
jgi:hypothetical protein